MQDTRNPTFTEVQSFFNEEYAYLKKWIAVNEPDWGEVLDECRAIEQRHPFEYCRQRLVLTTEYIEKSYMERKCNNG
jgi:hypothetical protein